MCFFLYFKAKSSHCWVDFSGKRFPVPRRSSFPFVDVHYWMHYDEKKRFSNTLQIYPDSQRLVFDCLGDTCHRRVSTTQWTLSLEGLTPSDRKNGRFSMIPSFMYITKNWTSFILYYFQSLTWFYTANEATGKYAFCQILYLVDTLRKTGEKVNGFYSQMLKIGTLFCAKNWDVGRKIADTFFLVDCNKLKNLEDMLGSSPGEQPGGTFWRPLLAFISSKYSVGWKFQLGILDFLNWLEKFGPATSVWDPTWLEIFKVSIFFAISFFECLNCPWHNYQIYASCISSYK